MSKKLTLSLIVLGNILSITSYAANSELKKNLALLYNEIGHTQTARKELARMFYSHKNFTYPASEQEYSPASFITPGTEEEMKNVPPINLDETLLELKRKLSLDDPLCYRIFLGSYDNELCDLDMNLRDAGVKEGSSLILVRTNNSVRSCREYFSHLLLKMIKKNSETQEKFDTFDHVTKSELIDYLKRVLQKDLFALVKIDPGHTDFRKTLIRKYGQDFYAIKKLISTQEESKHSSDTEKTVREYFETRNKQDYSMIPRGVVNPKQTCDLITCLKKAMENLI